MEQENPIKNIVADGGLTCILRSVACIGDSLSSGEHESKDLNGKVGYHDFYDYSWGQFMARKCGLDVKNFSCGGLTAKEFHKYADFHHCFKPGNLCKAYIIALGVNDLNHLPERYDNNFGDFSDVDEENWLNNKPTFVGEYVKIIQRIKEAQPKARIFLMTMPREPHFSAEKTALYDKHAELLNALTEKFEFTYVIDLRKYAPVYDKEFAKNNFLGGHLSAIGYKYTADMVATYIDYIIRNNLDDFKQIGFVGTGFYNCDAKW